MGYGATGLGRTVNLASIEPAVGPGWVDHSSRHVPGLFPLAVERVFNQVVSEHALAVTTVTTGARYYALHGLVAAQAQAKSLHSEDARALLRRCEVALALATLAHADSDEHLEDRDSVPHAADKLRVLLRAGSVDLAAVTADGAGAYIQAKWGVLGSTYRGAEMTVNVLDTAGLIPGNAYDDGPIRRALGDVFELAAKDAVTEDEAAHFGHLCLCQAATGPDAPWLRSLFTVPDAPTGSRGQVQRETTRLLARAIRHDPITDVHDDLVPFIMTHPAALDTAGTGADIARRWRGIAFRYESVNAWRFLWQALSDEVARNGIATRAQIRNWMADQAGPGTVRGFTESLPSPWAPDGTPAAAERHASLAGLTEIQRHLAVVFLGAQRLPDLHPNERLGFEGGPKTPTWALEEELGPRWVHRRAETWADRQMSDFAANLADVLIDRAQRLSLQKTRFDHRRGRVVIPGRIHTREDLVYRVYGEQARRAALRLPQLLSMGRQVGLFSPPDPLDQSAAWRLTGEGETLV